MSNEVKFVDNSKGVIKQLKANVTATEMALGLKAVELTMNQMQSGYSSPIRDSGDLMRDVKYKVTDNGVVIGNTLEYSIPVHEGTRKGIKSRPYIKDAILNGKKDLEEVAGQELKTGFSKTK